MLRNYEVRNILPGSVRVCSGKTIKFRNTISSVRVCSGKKNRDFQTVRKNDYPYLGDIFLVGIKDYL